MSGSMGYRVGDVLSIEQVELPQGNGCHCIQQSFMYHLQLAEPPNCVA